MTLARINNLFNELGSDLWDNRSLWNGTDRFFGTTDIIDTNTSFEVVVDLPGVVEDSIDIVLENGYLNISSEREITTEGKVIFSERQSGKIRRRIKMGNNADPNNVTASYKNGVLRITVPKKEASVKKIDVKFE